MRSKLMCLISVFSLFLFTTAGCDDDPADPETENYSAACQDGEDNDGDGAVDCDDEDCSVFMFCHDTDGDADSDSDSDVDGDGDGDADADVDGDGDADSDSDSDSDSDADDVCTDDEECNDGHDCTVDTCEDGFCENTPDDSLCDDEIACTVDTCDGFGNCQNLGPDVDEDGFSDSECGGTDCNDDDWDIAPGRDEECDGVDQDCDGTPDDGLCCLGSDVGLRLTDAERESLAPDAVFTGTGYGLTWKDSRESDTGMTSQIYFGLADADVNRVGEDVRLTTGLSAIHGPSIAWNPDDSLYGVVWTEYVDVVSHVFFILVDATGSAVGTPIQITTGADSNTALDVVWDGAEFGILYHSMGVGGTSVSIAQVGPDGSIVNPGVIIVDGSAETVDPVPDGVLVWAGDQYAALWIDWMGIGFGHVMLSYWTVDLSIGTDATEVSSSIEECRDVSAFWTGTQLLVAWSDQRDMGESDTNTEVYFNVVSSGTTDCTDTRVTDDTQSSGSPGIVADGEGILIAWQDRRSGRNVLLTRGVAYEAGSGCSLLTDEMEITWGDPRTPMLAPGTTSPIVFWSDARHAPRFEIYANNVACRAEAGEGEAD